MPLSSLDSPYIKSSVAGSLGVPASTLRSTIDPPKTYYIVTAKRKALKSKRGIEVEEGDFRGARKTIGAISDKRFLAKVWDGLQ